jgi:predicted permease
MSWWRLFQSRAKRRETELDSELRFHLQQVIDAKVAEGLQPEEARRQALVEFGGNEQVKEECRDVHRIASWENTVSNLKAALRFVKKSPGFSITVILTLALGIGANSAVFSAIDAVILRALPYPDSDQLVVLHQYNSRGKAVETNVATVRLEDWNRLSTAFDGIIGCYTNDLSETSGALPEKMSGALVTRRFLRVLGVSPVIGRDFVAEEERYGGPSAALISYGVWQRRFHGDPKALGAKLHFGKYDYTIIGVLPAGFSIPNRTTDLWSVSAPDAPFAQDRAQTWFFALGRLKPRTTPAQGQADLATVQAQLARQYAKTDRDISVRIESLKHSIVGESGSSLWLLFGAVSLLLLIACTNIAALLLARTSGRAQEITIRYSLGASRGSVVAQLLTEALVLALTGSVLGLCVAAAASGVLKSVAKTVPRIEEIQLDWSIVAYAVACAVICTLLFGLVPALQATRRTEARALAANSRTQVGATGRLQWWLVGAQVALAVMLLLGAGLLLRSFEALGKVHPGFDPNRVLTVRVSGSWGETADYKGLVRRVDNELDALRSVPGVVDAASSATLPGVSGNYPTEFKLIEGRALTEKILSDNKAVSARYFSTMRIPILSGRECQADPWGTVVVNQSFVRSFFGEASPLGHHLRWLHDPYNAEPRQIIGVVADARENGLRHPPMPVVYSCISAPDPSPYILVRTHGDPAAMGASLRRKMREVEPGRSVFDIVPLEQQLVAASAENRFRTLLLTLFALTAISLAAIGLYGTLSYFVTVRQREVGLRMALGAVPQQILQRFLLQGVAVACLGCAAGLALAAIASRALVGMLYGVSRVDALSYLGVAVVAVLVAAFASALPAARAARLDPMRVLRQE